jgi:hypothetical protein
MCCKRFADSGGGEDTSNGLWRSAFRKEPTSLVGATYVLQDDKFEFDWNGEQKDALEVRASECQRERSVHQGQRVRLHPDCQGSARATGLARNFDDISQPRRSRAIHQS